MSPLPISVRPPRPGDGSGICDPRPTREEQDEARVQEQRAEWAEALAEEHQRRQEERPTDEELAAREPRRLESPRAGERGRDR